MKIREGINETIVDYDKYRLMDAVDGARYLITSLYEKNYIGRSYKDFLEGRCGEFAIALYNIFRGKATIYHSGYHAVVKIGDYFYDANNYDITKGIKSLIGKEYYPVDFSKEDEKNHFDFFISICHGKYSKESNEKFEEEMEAIQDEVIRILGYEYSNTLKK